MPCTQYFANLILCMAMPIERCFCCGKGAVLSVPKKHAENSTKPVLPEACFNEVFYICMVDQLLQPFQTMQHAWYKHSIIYSQQINCMSCMTQHILGEWIKGHFMKQNHDILSRYIYISKKFTHGYHITVRTILPLTCFSGIAWYPWVPYHRRFDTLGTTWHRAFMQWTSGNTWDYFRSCWLVSCPDRLRYCYVHRIIVWSPCWPNS